MTVGVTTACALVWGLSEQGQQSETKVKQIFSVENAIFCGFLIAKVLLRCRENSTANKVVERVEDTGSLVSL